MPWPKGKPKGKKTGGRKKGTPNKYTGTSKMAIGEAFALLGGVEGLVAWARRNKAEFYKLWSKTIPREISGPGGGPIPFADMTTDAIHDELRRIRESRAARTAAGVGPGAGAGTPGNGGPVPGKPG